MVFSRNSSVCPSESTMPIDMTLPLCLSKEDFTCSSCEPARSSCLRLQPCADQTEARPSRQTKKRVTFADHRGLSLTRVKVFSEFSDPIEIPLNIQQMLSSAVSRAAAQDRLVLDFDQPSSDYLLFRQSLDRNYVSLEHCVLRERSFSGTVKVRNVSFEKAVQLRVTFDSWRSHVDVDCVYVRDAYPSCHSDTFSFEVALPAALQLHERVEFAVRYQVDGAEHWDSNHGNNYSIVWSSARTRRRDARGRRPTSFDFGIHLDRYGSPTCSHGILPDWPSYAGYENAGPYY